MADRPTDAEYTELARTFGAADTPAFRHSYNEQSDFAAAVRGDAASSPTDAAIEAIRDRLTPSTGPMAQSSMSDYDNDPVTNNDLLQNLNNWLVDDPDFIYSQLAEETGAEDTPEFRHAVDDELSKERGDFCNYDRGDDPGRESDLDQGTYTPAEWYGDAQQAADDEDVQ